MKKWTGMVLFTLWAAGQVWALNPDSIKPGDPQAPKNSQDYAIYGSSPARPPNPEYTGGPKLWTFGVEVDHQRRDVVYEDVDETHKNWTVLHLLMFLDYDLLPWLSLHGQWGAADLDEGDDIDYDYHVEWGAGLRGRFLDYKLPTRDPYWFRVEGSADYKDMQADADEITVEWHEFEVALTAGLVTKPNLDYESDIHSVGLYVGPAYSRIEGTDEHGAIKTDFEEDQNIGIVGGLTVDFSDYMFMKIEGQFFDQSSVNGCVGIHF